MHALLFGVKRAFHSSVRVLLDFVSQFELTPARYDLLFVVRERGTSWMSEIRRMLGVTAATVSRMVKSLVDRGLVTLSRPAEDRRQREIALTAKGEECMRRALAALRHSGGIDFFVEAMFGPASDDRTERMVALQQRLAEIRQACGDTSSDPDPWDPHDLDAENIEFYESMLAIDELEPDDLGPAAIPIA